MKLWFWHTNRRVEAAPRRAQPRHEANYTFALQPPPDVSPLVQRASTDALVGMLNREVSDDDGN